MSFRPGSRSRWSTNASSTRKPSSAVLIQRVCGSTSTTSKRSGQRSSNGSIAAEYVIPTPNKPPSAVAAEALCLHLVVDGDQVELVPERDVEAGAAGGAAQLPERHGHRLLQGLDVAAHPLRQHHVDLPTRNAPEQLLDPAGWNRLRIELHCLAEADELAFMLKEQRVASRRAGGMTHPPRQLCQAALQPVEVVRNTCGHRQADSAALQANLRCCSHISLLRPGLGPLRETTARGNCVPTLDNRRRWRSTLHLQRRCINS